MDKNLACLNRLEASTKTHDYDVPDEVKAALFEQNDSALPLITPLLLEYSGIKKRSLQTNKRLACQWNAFKDIKAAGVDLPKFESLSHRHYHFHNYVMKYAPSETLDSRPHFRYQMRLGPGFDDNSLELLIPNFSFRTRIVQRPPVFKRKSAPKKK